MNVSHRRPASARALHGAAPRLRALGALLLASAVGLAACQDPVAVIPDELAGHWRTNLDCAPPCALTLYWDEPSPGSANLLTTPFLMELHLRLQRGGAAQLDIFSPRAPDTTVHGQARVADGFLLLEGTTGIVDTLEMNLSGNVLELVFHQDIDLPDVGGDTWIRAVLQRR